MQSNDNSPPIIQTFKCSRCGLMWDSESDICVRCRQEGRKRRGEPVASAHNTLYGLPVAELPTGGHACEYTADGLDPTPGNPACGQPATVCNPHGASGKGARWFDYDEWYCRQHADPAWAGARS